MKRKINREEYETLSAMFWIAYRLMSKFNYTREMVDFGMQRVTSAAQSAIKMGQTEDQFVEFMRKVPDDAEVADPPKMGTDELQRKAQDHAIAFFKQMSPTGFGDADLIHCTLAIMVMTHLDTIFVGHKTTDPGDAIALMAEWWNMTHDEKIDVLATKLKPGDIPTPPKEDLN